MTGWLLNKIGVSLMKTILGRLAIAVPFGFRQALV